MTARVREIEERSAAAWPARETFRVGGWECRFSGGHTGRANSVNPQAEAPPELDRAVRRCEELFRERELRPLFRLTPLCRPSDLDALLERRRYVRRSETLVMTRTLAPEARDGVPELEISERVSAEWLQLLSKWLGIPPERERLHREILERIRPERAVATVRESGRVAACGLAVREGGWVGLFDLVTSPELRGRGHGTRLVEGLLAWGMQGAAGEAYLQVEATNAAALRLYRKLGFHEEYRYGYRVSTEESPHRLPKAPD